MMENYNDLLTETAPAEQSDYDKASWKNRKKAEREEAFARVADAALQISGSPTLLQNYLNVQAQFGRYSINNCLLIATSKPASVTNTGDMDSDVWLTNTATMMICSRTIKKITCKHFKNMVIT